MNREEMDPPPPGVEPMAPPPPPNGWFHPFQQPGDGGMQPGPYPWQLPHQFQYPQQMTFPWQQPPPLPMQQSKKPKIELPTFWHRDPQSWFGLAESSFDREDVTDAKYKFDIVLKFLNDDIVEQIRDLLRTARSLGDPYEALKAELVRLYSPNVIEQLNGIVFCPELGGQAPSQLMNKLLSLLPAGEPAGLLFKHHFILRLPSDIRDQVAKKMEKMGPKELGEYADNRWHIRNSRPPTTGVTAAVQPPAVEELTEAVAAISTGGSKHNRRRKGGRQQPGEKPVVKTWFCFNHNRYGKSAWSCSDTKNCSFQGNGEAGGQ